MRPAPRLFPVFLDLDARPAVVVGGGPAALRRAKQLSGYGADVTVITAAPDAQLSEAEAAGVLMIENRGYIRGDLAGAFVAICVETDPEIQQAVRAEAESAGCLINVADAPLLCNFVVPSVVNRSPLQIAVSTGGTAPGLAKQVRRELLATYGPEWAAYSQLIGEVRSLVFTAHADDETRESVLAAVTGSDLLDQARAGKLPTAQAVYEQFAPKDESEGGEQ